MYATPHSHPFDWDSWLRKSGPSMLVGLAVTGLTLLGLLVLYSAGRTEPGGASIYAQKQAVWLVIALLAFVFTWRIDLERLRPLAWWMAGGAALLLVAVLIPGIGHKVNGARRWIEFGPMNLQVSDPVKVVMIFLLAHYLATNQRRLKEFIRGFAIPCLIFGTVFLFVLKQPDFGTALLCAVIGVTLLFLAGTRLVYLLPSTLLGAALFSLAVSLDPVRRERILSFLDVEGNKMDGAYQLWQGILAFGAGGWQGVGLGNGRQQMAFLPEAHTDFIFPIIGEELGLVFTAGVTLAFLLIFIVTVWRLSSAPNLFQFLLCAGALCLIVFQAMINFGVVTGLLPTKGMSLPFISYGGSNLVAVFVLLGIILNCLRNWNQSPVLVDREVDF